MGFTFWISRVFNNIRDLIRCDPNSLFFVSSHMTAAFQGSRLGQIILHSRRQVINLSCSRQSGLHGQTPAQGSQISTAKTPAPGRQASTAKTPAEFRQASTAKALLLKAGRLPRSHISHALCSPINPQLRRMNSLNCQPNYLVRNSREYMCALAAQPFLLFVVGEHEINWSYGSNMLCAIFQSSWFRNHIIFFLMCKWMLHTQLLWCVTSHHGLILKSIMRCGRLN